MVGSPGRELRKIIVLKRIQHIKAESSNYLKILLQHRSTALKKDSPSSMILETLVLGAEFLVTKGYFTKW
jgi:hypothetical protein